MLSFLVTMRPGHHAEHAMAGWVVGITLAGRNHELHPAGDFSQETSDLVAIEANVAHRWVVPEGAPAWRTLFFVFHPRPSALLLLRQLPELRPGFRKLPLAKSPARNRVRAALLGAHRALSSPWPNRFELATSALEHALLWCQTELERTRTATEPRVQKAVAHLLRNLAGPIYLEELAKVCSLSVPRLEALFKKHVGVPPMAFLESARLERARDILSTSGYSVKETASLVGYDDPVHFAKRFAKRFQASPRQYRLARRPR